MSNWVGPLYLYSHAEHDEEVDSYFEVSELPEGLDMEDAIAMASTNPLYETEFEFFLNPDTKEYYLTQVRSTQHKEFEGEGLAVSRPAPGDDVMGIPYAYPPRA